MRKLSPFQVGALASLLAMTPVAGRAQTSAAAPVADPPQSSQPPSGASATQPSDPTSAASVPDPTLAPSQSHAAPGTNAKPAKVWTNDEIDVLRGNRTVSVVGKNSQSAGATSAKPKGYSIDKDPKWYRKQLEPLQAEIDKLDVQIEKTKAFLNGEHVNDTPAASGAYHGMPGNPQEQLRKLEDQRDKDVAKVNDLLDRARHNDIPPGDLR